MSFKLNQKCDIHLISFHAENSTSWLLTTTVLLCYQCRKYIYIFCNIERCAIVKPCCFPQWRNLSSIQSLLDSRHVSSNHTLQRSNRLSDAGATRPFQVTSPFIIYWHLEEWSIDRHVDRQTDRQVSLLSRHHAIVHCTIRFNIVLGQKSLRTNEILKFIIQLYKQYNPAHLTWSTCYSLQFTYFKYLYAAFLWPHPSL